MKTILKFVFLLLFFSLTSETIASANCLYKAEYISSENGNEQALNANNATLSANTPPSGSFTFLDKQCSSNHVQFTTSTSATAPYSYFWDFGDTFTSTLRNPTHKFTVTNALSSQTFNVTLIITDTITLETTQVVKPVTVLTAPDATLTGTGSGAVVNGMPAFQINTNAPQVFTFTNGSTTIGTNTKYTINWGDGSANFSATKWTTVNHTYPIGTWTALYTIEGANGCTTVQPFIVFIGLKPIVILEEPAKIDPCKPGPVTFPISGTRNNPPGTTYTVSFNDGSPDTILNHPPPPSIVHSFKKSSCGVTSKGIMNSFYANIVATNPSGTSESFVVPLYISTPLTATCTLSSPITCINTPVCVENTSKGGVVVTAAGCEQPKSYWTITPSVGVTLASGIMGNNNGSTDPDFWTPGSDEICPQFSLPGKYTITYNIGNSCGVFKVDSKVCVEEPLVPDFNLDKNTGCIPTPVNATSTTNMSNTCTIPIYKWDVSYTDGYCGTTSSYTVKNDSTPNASFEFKSAGIYHVKLSVTNSCGVRSATKDVIISMPPSVKVDTIPDFCGTASIRPKPVVYSCAPVTATVNYFWEFPGGVPATSNIEYPWPINYALPGTYDVKLYVTNACGASALSTRRFTIHETPTSTVFPLDQTVCSGYLTTAVPLTADKPGTTFSWTATATAGISGFISSGTGNTIPVHTITTINPSAGAVTYKITPLLGTCPGTPVDYVINVIPQPVLSSQPIGDDVCLNATPTPLTVGYIGTVDLYQWYANATNSTVGGIPIPGANAPTYKPLSNVLGTKYYYCILNIPVVCTTITSNVVAVSVNAIPAVLKDVEAVTTICEGGSILNPLTMTFTGGAGTPTYKWFEKPTLLAPGVPVLAGGSSATYTPPSNLSIGSHYFYVEISFTGSGCTPITSGIAEVIVVPDPTVTDPVSLPPVCQYETPTALSVTASGGIGSIYSYQWYQNTNNNNNKYDVDSKLITLNGNGQTFDPPTTAAGTMYYFCEVTQPGGCGVTSNAAKVVVDPAPTFTKLPDATYCVGTSPTDLVMTVVGGVSPTYEWFSNSVPSVFGTPSLLGPGTATGTGSTYLPSAAVSSDLYYYCKVSFGGGGACTELYSNFAHIIVNDKPSIAGQIIDICSGEPFLFTPKLTDLAPLGTTYTWTVSLPSGVTVASNPLVPALSISQILTNNNSTTSTVTYLVTPTSPGAGCDGLQFTITVNVRPAITLTPSATSDVTCFGAKDGAITVNVDGGTKFASPAAPYKVSWTGPVGFVPSAFTSLTGLGPGTYNLTITDALGCTALGTYTLQEPPLLQITNGVKKNIPCFGAANGEIDITVTGGTSPTYSWTKDGVAYDNNEDLVNLGPGTYKVIVSDANGCGPISQTFTITQPVAPLTVTGKVSQKYDCIHPTVGSIDITALGGTWPYTYAWVGGAGSTDEDLVDVPPGNYTVTVTDKNGCQFPPLSFRIIQPLPITIDVNFTDEYDCASKTAYKRSVATVTGGFPPYTLTWSRGTAISPLNEIMTTSQSGLVNLIVVDAKGCQADSTYNLDVVKPELQSVLMDCRRFMWEFTAIDPHANGQFYSYNWDFGDGTTSTSQKVQHSYANPGWYNVVLTMSSATCPAIVYRRTVVVEPLARLSLGNTVRLCEGDSITQRVIGGTFTKLWSNYSTKDSLVIKQQGDYSVICTSPNGCTDTLNFTVLTDMYNYVIETDRNELTLDGKPLKMWTQETSPSQYSWDFGDGTFGNGNPVTHAYNIVKDGAIEIKLRVTNPYGCTETATKRMWVVNNSLANTFTPNGDGINDVFMPGWNMKVYNRNGILVYEGDKGWDGTYKGQLVSKDTYYYVMDYVTETGAKFKDGYVMVVR